SKIGFAMRACQTTALESTKDARKGRIDSTIFPTPSDQPLLESSLTCSGVPWISVSDIRSGIKKAHHIACASRFDCGFLSLLGLLILFGKALSASLMKVFHSSRNVFIGSTLVARYAGTAVASKATPASSIETLTIVTG